MRKKLTAVLAAVLILAGCRSGKNTDTGMVNYEGYFRAVEANAKFEESSLYYTVSTEMNQMADGTYRYYLIIDEPKIAMYDIVILAVENNAEFERTSKMMPSSGIFDDAVSMIPGQVNSAAGYVKGIALSGETDQPTVELRVQVRWNDKNRQKETREFLTVTAAMEAEGAGQ